MIPLFLLLHIIIAGDRPWWKGTRSKVPHPIVDKTGRMTEEVAWDTIHSLKTCFCAIYLFTRHPTTLILNLYVVSNVIMNLSLWKAHCGILLTLRSKNSVMNLCGAGFNPKLLHFIDLCLNFFFCLNLIFHMILCEGRKAMVWWEQSPLT